MLTKFGKELRKIRLDRDELLRDMADKLDVTVAYLSAVENGKRKIPDEWIQKISIIYSLTDKEIENLQRLAYENRSDLRLDLTGTTPGQRELAYSFARRFQNMSSHEMQEIRNILDKGGIG